MKPPYSIPTMKQVAKLKGTNGLSMVSTFSGAGGSCLGFEMAGFEILWASEFVEAAREVYEANHPGVHVDDRDIRDVSGDDILKAIGKEKGDVDVLEGSPPCASFSMVGRRDKAWGTVSEYSDTHQRTDDLFFEFSRLVGEIQPRVFVAENVAGLVLGAAKGYFKIILSHLKSNGYRVAAQLLDAQWLGVPQSRRRLIFIGVRNDLDREPVHPTPLPYRYTIREALTGLIAKGKTFTLVGWNGENFDRKGKHFSADEPAPTILASPHQFRLEGDGGGPYTGTGRHISVGHRVRFGEIRDVTMEELRRLCGFPDDFKLSGTYRQQWERLGRAVPSPMSRAIAETIRDQILIADGAGW